MMSIDRIIVFTKSCSWVLLLVVCQLSAGAALGAVIASDSASDPAYAAETGGAWKGLNPTSGENPPGTDNGGFGFLPWDFAGGFHAQQFSPYGRLNHFIDGVDFSSSAFNSLGAPAFALTNANQAWFGYTARATRPFASPLQIGDTLSIDFSNPLPLPLAEFDSAGFVFRLNTGGGPLIEGISDVAEKFGLFVTGDFHGDNWTTTDSVGFTDTGINASETTSGAQFRFTLTGSDSYSMELIRLGDGASLFERSGFLRNEEAGPIDAIEITLFGNGSGDGVAGPTAQRTGEREFFFDNLVIERPESFYAPGDFDADGIVDGRDFLIWQQGGSPNPWSPADLADWEANFGAGPSAMSASTIVVPEPTSLTMVLSYLLILAAGRATLRVVARRRFFAI